MCSDKLSLLDLTALSYIMVLSNRKEVEGMVKKTQSSEIYGASAIQVLEGLEPVRKRPGMYIGGTGFDGLHHLIKEIADNSIDEAIAGEANEVIVTMLADGGVQVSDNGRGIPVDTHPKTGKSTLETVLTILHAGVSSAVVVIKYPAVYTA